MTRNFDCLDGPSGKFAAQAIYESGSVVCGIIPKEMGQGLENGIMVWATRMGKLEPFFRRMTERPAVAQSFQREGIPPFGAP